MDFDLYRNNVGQDDDYEENQEKVNTNTLKLIKKRKIHEYRGI
jgi:hypothetical protein